MALVKLDEDLPQIVAEPLLERGHEVRSTIAQGLGGASDDALWEAISAEGAILITADKGFADVRAHPPGTHPGIILLRPESESLLAYKSLLLRLLEMHDLAELGGTITVATHRHVRIRRA